VKAANLLRPKRNYRPNNAPTAWITQRACAICGIMCVGFDQLGLPTRNTHVHKARAIVAHILHEFPGPGGQWASYPDIAASTGRNNHSSVIGQHGVLLRAPDWRRDADLIARSLGLRTPAMKDTLREVACGRI
jgi:hypothetical protein